MERQGYLKLKHVLWFFPSTKYERSLKQNCPGWFNSLLKSALNLFKCLEWELQETGFWTLPKDKQAPRLDTLPWWVLSFQELSFLINVVSAETALVPGHCQHWRLMWPQPLVWKVPWVSVSPSVSFYQLEQGHCQSHTGSKSKPEVSSLTGSKDPGFQQDLSILTLWHSGLEDSLLWALSCALQAGQQHPFPPPVRCLWPQLWQPKLSLDIAKYHPRLRTPGLGQKLQTGTTRAKLGSAMFSSSYVIFVQILKIWEISPTNLDFWLLLNIWKTGHTFCEHTFLRGQEVLKWSLSLSPSLSIVSHTRHLIGFTTFLGPTLVLKSSQICL